MRELCTNCGAETDRAGRGEDSLYAGDFGPYCEDCWDELREDLAADVKRRTAQSKAFVDLAYRRGCEIAELTGEVKRLTTLLEESRAANRKNIATMTPIAKGLKERAEKAEAALEESRAVKRKQISVISEIAGQLKDRAEKAEAALAKAKGEDA